MRAIQQFVKYLIKNLNLRIIRYSKLEKLKQKATAAAEIKTLRRSAKQNARAAADMEILMQLPNQNTSRLLKYLPDSKAHLRQDLFVLSHLDFKTNGFFVEFGATNGVTKSNTHLLEKEFGWTGILAEPARCWHEDLKKNRHCSIDTKCVWKNSGSNLIFNETQNAELSTINLFSEVDSHKEKRKRGTTYDVRTISLNDLLIKHNAPKEIDYLSIDTEGSEFEILGNFDFSKHSFKVITCEHNYTPMREKLFNLLSLMGYTRVYQQLSKCDDWYVRAY